MENFIFFSLGFFSFCVLFKIPLDVPNRVSTTSISNFVSVSVFTSFIFGFSSFFGCSFLSPLSFWVLSSDFFVSGFFGSVFSSFFLSFGVLSSGFLSSDFFLSFFSSFFFIFFALFFFLLFILFFVVFFIILFVIFFF